MLDAILRGSIVIDWDSSSNQLLYNPRMPEQEKEQLLSALDSFKSFNNHFLVATSGSTGKIKWTALSKEAVLLSAQAVNSHLESNQEDLWLNPLPLFHVGGLGIAARAMLSKAKVIHTFDAYAKWDAGRLMQQLADSQATLLSLVPAQLYDLVVSAKHPPSSLRAVIIGGGSLDEALYFKAVESGWPLLPSYGLTECCSQVATSPLGSWKTGNYPLLKPLEHIQLQLDEKGHLKICSNSLLTGYLEPTDEGMRFSDPKREKWFHTQDIVELKQGWIATIRREDRMIKIGGESVDLARLERILEEEKRKASISCDLALIATPDEKLGHLIQLLSDQSFEGLQELVFRFNERVFPFERIRNTHLVSKIPRSPLRKLIS